MPATYCSYIAFNSNQIKLIENANPTNNVDVRYSDKVESAGSENYYNDENGIVVISPTSFVKHDFDKRYKATKEAIYQYLRQLNEEKVEIKSDGRIAFFDAEGAWEYTHSKSAESNFIDRRKAKAEITRGLKKILETAYYDRWRENTETNNKKKDSKRGMLRYNVLFGIGDENPEYYSGKILISQSSDGNDYIYDIVNIIKRGQLSELTDETLASIGIVQRTADDVNSELENGRTITSANTSRKQNASTFSTYQFSEGERILDYGGGSYDISRLVVKGSYDDVTIEAVDLYNRTSEHNKRVLDIFSKNKATSITINNVLNVIDSVSAIREVLNESKKYLNKNEICYVKIYQGDGTGKGRD